MLDEDLALLRAHYRNVRRYQELLETDLTDFEREYIGKRLVDERSEIDALSHRFIDLNGCDQLR